MDFKNLFFCFVVMLHRVRCQEPRCVSIFDDKGEISNSGIIKNTGISGCRGKKGERGIPGKAGIPGSPGQKGSQGVRGLRGINGAAGIRGHPGTKGNQGVKGESGSTDGIAACEQKIQNLMTDFDRSLSLLESKLNAAIKRIDDLSRSVNCSQCDKDGSQVNSADLTQPVSCSQSDKNGSQILSSGEKVFCHQQWRVVQRRFNGQVIFHNKTWNEYKNGFGNLSTEFWIGLDNIHRLTKNGGCKLRVELGAFDGSEAYAEYRKFSIGSESDLFRLHISEYSGTAGDSIMPSGNNNNNMAFTTIDRDNDRWSSKNCAAHVGGGRGAWWYNACGSARLNGRWREGLNTWQSFVWYHWKQSTITLKSSMMMIRCD